MTYNPGYSMDLGRNWDWDTRKLPCKIRPESGNPAIDELRQRLSDLTGVPIPDAPAKKEKQNVKKPPPGGLKPVTEATNLGKLSFNTCNEVIQKFDSTQAMKEQHEKNINKKFFRIPRAPPLKVVQDMQAVVLAQSTGEGNMPTFEEVRPIVQKPVKKKKKKKKSDVVQPPIQEYVPPPTPQDQVLKVRHYGGDKFGQNGNYMHGMVYLSRLPPNGGVTGLGRTRTTSAGSMAGTAGDSLLRSPKPNRSIGVEEPMTSDSVKALEAKLHCAATLAGWAQHDANTERLAAEGAVDAIILLSKEENLQIQRHCANALRYMSERPALCEQLIRNSPAQLVLELAGQEAKDEMISRDCAICLVNLTRMDGIEAKLVEDAMVMALMTMLNARDELAGLCARGLFNLTCVDTSYMYVERVIKSFVTLATSSSDVKHICASGLCNLADLKELRPRLVEEGVVQCLMILAKGAESRTRRVCATILHSLALTQACRGEMISKGAINVLYSLSGDEDPTTLHYIASGIIYLAMETQNATSKQKTLTRLINDKGVISLCNICMRCPTVSNTTVLCAAALQLLSQHTIDANAPQIVQEGCVPALVTLLRESKDTDTLRHSLSALCNLLTSEDNHLSIIQQGGVTAVIELTGYENGAIKETCALALYNLARGEATRDHPINTDAIPAIIKLSRLDNPVTQMRCAAALCKLAVNVNNVPLMISEGVVPAFIEMLKTENPDIVRHCCSALCCLAHEGSSCVMIAEGAGAAIIDGATKGDVTTQQACCAVISIISSQEQCRRQLVNMGALPALISLSEMNHTTTRLRCAVAFANLSAESTVQGLMVDAGVVTAVAKLSAPSPSFDAPVEWDSVVNGDDDFDAHAPAQIDGQLNGEDHQLFCAKALCNLGCHNGSEKKIVEQGGVKTLMMICMVRAVKQFTKQVSAKALLNLLNDDNLVDLVEQHDLVKVIASLSKRPTPPKKEDETLLKVCAEIFLKLSGHDVGRKYLIARESTLEAVFKLMRSKDVQTQTHTGKTACNLIACADSQTAAVSAGAVLVLKNMCTISAEGIKEHCAWSFFLVCGKEKYRNEIVKNQVLPVIILLARSINKATQLSCVRALCNMAYHQSTRRALLESGTVAAIVRLTSECMDTRILKMCTYIISYLSLETGETIVDKKKVTYQMKIVNDEVIGALVKIWGVLKDVPEVLRRCALTLRTLSEDEDARIKMIQDGSMRFLEQIVNASGDLKETQYEISMHAGTIIYNFCCSPSKDALVDQGVLSVLTTVYGNPKCASLVSACMYLISLQKRHAEKLVQGSIPELLLKLAGGEDRGTVQNCAGIFFILSKANTNVKDKLTEAGVVPMLVSLSKSPHERIRLSCSEALKNISSTGGDGIEEGTVMTLITSALSGSVGNSDSMMDEAVEHERPTIASIELTAYDLPPEYLPAFDESFKPYSIPGTKHSGAAAGAGPPPPETPPMETQEEAEIKLEDEDGNDVAGANNGDDEVPADKVMMFAKMDVPKEFLEKARVGE